MAKPKTITELTQTDFTALSDEIVGETTYALLQAVFLAEPFSLSNIQNFTKDATNRIIHFSANVNKESRLIGNSAPATTGKLLKFYLFDVQIDVTTTERHLVFYLDDSENKTITPLDLLKSFAPPASTDPVDPDDEPLTLEGLYGGASSYFMTLNAESIQDTNPNNPGATSIPYFFSSLDKETYDNATNPILNKTQLEAKGIPSYLAKSGLNFNIKTTFQDSLAKAISDLGLSEFVEFSLEGSIQQTSSGSLWLEMAKPFQDSFTLGQFQFTLTEIGFTSTVDYLGQEMPSILFTGKIQFANDSRSPAKLDIQITLSLVRQIITIEFIELQSIGETFPEFAKAVGIKNDTFSVVTNLPGIGDASAVFNTTLDHFTFSQLELIFGISPFSLEADFTITTTKPLSFSLQSDTPHPNGAFEVSLQPWFHLHYQKDPIASNAVKQIQMGGIWKLGPVDSETEIDILIDLNEQMLYADMAVGNYLNIGEFGEALFPDVKENLPKNLILTDFELVADLTNKSFELEVGISNDWEVSVGNISFAFTELDLEVGYSHGALQYVYMEGMFEVAGIHFPVAVLYDKPHWIIRGGMQPGDTIYFSQIYEGLIGSTYSDTGLIHFTNINISELYLEYQTETGGFNFYTKLNEVLTISDTFKIEWVFFEIDTNQDSADVTVKSKFAVQIKPADNKKDPVIPAEEIDFFLNYEQNSQGLQ